MTDDTPPPRSRWRPGRISGWYAALLVWLRWPIVVFWAVAAAAGAWFLPPLGHGGSDLEQLVSADNPAIRSELRSFEKFGYPLLSRVAVVQRNPDGLSAETQLEAVERARTISEGTGSEPGPILAAVPVMNTLGLVPGSKESDTTIVTLLFTAPDVGFADQLDVAEDFVARYYDADDHVVGITGSVPARVEQGEIVLEQLPWLETVTVVAVFLIVAFAFRSLAAPLIALVVAGVAILLTLFIGGALAERFGVPVPQETQPLLVALLLGVVTDYVVFYLSAVRTQLAAGAGRLEAARGATARFTPIIATAGLTAAAGTGALIVADSAAFRAFGPGMALAVLIGLVVAVTLVPALLAILGRAAFWSPGRSASAAGSVAAGSASAAGSVAAGSAAAGSAAAEAPASRAGGRWARLLTRRWFAPAVLLVCVAGLALATYPVRNLNLGVSFVEALPADHPARVAAEAAQTGFADGILSPTEVLLEGDGVTARAAELTKFQKELEAVPGVAAVLGPGSQAIREQVNIFDAPDGSAVRFLLVLGSQPLGAEAIDTVSQLDGRLPAMVSAAGLTDTRVSLGGDTAIAELMVDQTVSDLGRIAVAALLANLLFLVLFLRALVVPIALLLCSVLAIGATLGLTTWLFQDVLGGDGLTFYVPFAAAVLLVALGSDYNIFGIGPAWREARTRPLREALAMTLPSSARAIRTAAFTLAVSFGLLILVPLRPFQELAFALSVGILIDAFVVRSLLAPALLTMMGSAAEPPDSTQAEIPAPRSEPAESTA